MYVKFLNELSILPDVVAAHKSLLIEKKALEDTISILSASKQEESKTELIEFDEISKENETASDKNEEEKKNQLSLLLSSISKLVAEKSHMEESFKTNQKQILEDKKAIEDKCKKLEEKVKILTKQIKNEESKTPGDFFFLKKDSKKHAKGDSLQNKKPFSKTDVLHNSNIDDLMLQIKNYEKEIKNLKSELEAKRIVQELSEKKVKDCTIDLNKLQEEVRNLQIEHQVALKVEKEKSKNIEDHAKKTSAAQEERVVNLETRLAELSETIGSYDRLRLQDQAEIHKLKEHITQMDLTCKGNSFQSRKELPNSDDFDDIVENIINLKKHLQIKSIQLGREEDFQKLFPDTYGNETSHTSCKEELNKIKAEYDLLKNTTQLNKANLHTEKEVTVYQNQIKNLQEKVKNLSEKNEIMENEWKLQVDQLKKTMKNEKERFKDTLSASELDFRGRVWLLEEQLQKQRERSLALLEEKEQEIQSLQNTFQMLLPGNLQNSNNSFSETKILPSQIIDGPHIVHYTNELARKDIEITNLRKSKNQMEIQNRDLQKEIISITEKHKEELQILNAEISR